MCIRDRADDDEGVLGGLLRGGGLGGLEDLLGGGDGLLAMGLADGLGDGEGGGDGLGTGIAGWGAIRAGLTNGIYIYVSDGILVCSGGTLDASGGDGSTGGDAGYVELDAYTFLYNTADLIANGGDGWTTMDGDPGMQANLRFNDETGDGLWSDGEDIWADEAGGNVGLYDDGIDTVVTGGGDAWTGPYYPYESGPKGAYIYGSPDGHRDGIIMTLAAGAEVTLRGIQ